MHGNQACTDLKLQCCEEVAGKVEENIAQLPLFKDTNMWHNILISMIVNKT
jgi:hypothetical protein